MATWLTVLDTSRRVHRVKVEPVTTVAEALALAKMKVAANVLVAFTNRSGRSLKAATLETPIRDEKYLRLLRPKPEKAKPTTENPMELILGDLLGSLRQAAPGTDFTVPEATVQEIRGRYITLLSTKDK